MNAARGVTVGHQRTFHSNGHQKNSRPRGRKLFKMADEITILHPTTTTYLVNNVEFRQGCDMTCDGCYSWIQSWWLNLICVVNCDPGDEITVRRKWKSVINIKSGDKEITIKKGFSMPGICQIYEQVNNGMSIVLSALGARKQ